MQRHAERVWAERERQIVLLLPSFFGGGGEGNELPTWKGICGRGHVGFAPTARAGQLCLHLKCVLRQCELGACAEVWRAVTSRFARRPEGFRGDVLQEVLWWGILRWATRYDDFEYVFEIWSCLFEKSYYAVREGCIRRLTPLSSLHTLRAPFARECASWIERRILPSPQVGMSPGNGSARSSAHNRSMRYT